MKDDWEGYKIVFYGAVAPTLVVGGIAFLIHTIYRHYQKKNKND